MNKRHFLRATALASLAIAGSTVFAQDNVFKIGLILPMTGPFASTGKQLEAAARLYMAQNGDTVAGKKIDHGLMEETAKRIARARALYYG